MTADHLAVFEKVDLIILESEKKARLFQNLRGGGGLPGSGLQGLDRRTDPSLILLFFCTMLEMLKMA